VGPRRGSDEHCAEEAIERWAEEAVVEEAVVEGNCCSFTRKDD
jgi:hypothetical protein